MKAGTLIVPIERVALLKRMNEKFMLDDDSIVESDDVGLIIYSTWSNQLVSTMFLILFKSTKLGYVSTFNLRQLNDVDIR